MCLGRAEVRYVYTFPRQPNGTTDIDVVIVREGKNLKEKLLAFVFGTIGWGVLEKAFRNSVKVIEVRNNGGGEDRRILRGLLIAAVGGAQRIGGVLSVSI